MKQQVNLYTEAFRPNQAFLTLELASGLTGLGLAVVVAVAGWFYYQVQQLETQQKAMEDRLAVQQDAVTSLNEELEQRTRDPQLQDRIERLEQRAEQRKRLLGRADAVVQASSEGFTPYLEGLARQTADELWLTRINVNLMRETLQFEGKNLNGDAVPDFLRRLRQEPVFDGRRFARLEIGREEQGSGLRFNIASQRDGAEENQ